MDHNITKKRKLKADDAVTNGVAPAKKSKQVKPVSKRAEVSEDDDVDNEDDEEEKEEDDEDDEDEDDNKEEDAEEGEEEAASGADLPVGAVPVLPPSAADAADSFDELKLSDKTMQAIGEMGFTKMTSIQRAVRIFFPLLTKYPALLTTASNRPFPRCSLARMFSVPPRLVRARLLLS